MFTASKPNLIVLLALAAIATGCDKAQLLAPTQSTITVSAPTRVLPSNGTTPVTASVLEQAGTPVQNGTTVRFTTTLGRIDPVEVQTTNGLAITTFFAGPNSGIAEIQANSGAATGGTGSGTGNGGTGTTGTNVIRITVGAAAVNTVTLRANPGSVGPNGGTVEMIASVVGENGQPLDGILVTFNADQGSLGSTTAVTNPSGEARTSLTTSQQTLVSATAGTKTSSNVTITLRAGPIVTITCAPTAGTATTNCNAVGATTSANTATVAFTITRATGSSALRAATIDFGDGTNQSLGNLGGGSITVTHTYGGPTDLTPRTYTASVVATDINGETTTSSVPVVITPRNVTPIAVTLTATEGTRTQRTARWTFTATATGGGEGGTGNANIVSYEWDFGDGNTSTTTGPSTSHVYERNLPDPQTERREVTVTARTADGRSGTARESIIIQYNATPP